MSHILLLRYHVAGLPEDQIKSNKFISETADLKIEIQDNDNVLRYGKAVAMQR